MIGFFSSDARDLYEADVFRALALPNDFVLHFRYRSKYVDDDISYNLMDIIGEQGAIFYSIGNKLDADERDRITENISIRKVFVKDVYKDANTNLIHFYLGLGDFDDLEIHNAVGNDKLPPKRFVSNIQLHGGPNKSWIKRIEKIEDNFPSTLFFNISHMKESGDNVEPKYSASQKKSYYELYDEKEYTLDVSFYDVRCGTSYFRVSTTGEVLSSNIPEESTLGAIKDYKVYTLSTRSINARKSNVNVKFSSEYRDDDIEGTYDVDLPITVLRQKNKPVWFALFTVLFFLGLAIGQLAIKIADAELGWPSLLLLAGSLLAIGLGSAFLYMFFNKK